MSKDTAATECALKVALLFNNLERKERIASVAYEAFEKAQHNVENASAEFEDEWSQFLRLFGSEAMEEYFTEDEIMKMRKVLNV